jgi:hypothetical protein
MTLFLRQSAAIAGEVPELLVLITADSHKRHTKDRSISFKSIAHSQAVIPESVRF